MSKSISLALIAPVVLSGCSAHYPVVGSFDDFDEVLYGTVDHNLANGTAYVQLEGKVAKMKCAGNSQVTYIPAYNYLVPTCSAFRALIPFGLLRS